MKADDFLYGCRSAIQKGIRRGDLDLVMTAFDTLWEVKAQRNWLQWRTTVLCEEDVWHMLGELSLFYGRVKKVKEDPEAHRKAWLKMLIELALCSKSKDTEALYYTAKDTKKKKNEHAELVEMRELLGMVSTEPLEAAGVLLDGMKEQKVEEYRMRAARMLHSRMFQGGMYDDRMACLAGMVLVNNRPGFDPKTVKQDIADGLKRYKVAGGKKPKKKELPWYVFDMHTAAGKFASSVFMKHKAKDFPGLTKDKFEWIWFDLESAKVPKSLMKVKKFSLKAQPTAIENMWWGVQVKRDLPFGDYSALDVVRLWRTKMRPELKSIVNWCLEKRSKKN